MAVRRAADNDEKSEMGDEEMKILVYGCGVIGSYLTHVLCRAGNDVTVCARGKTKIKLEKCGLRIKHKLQKSKTVDYPKVIGKADETEHYDIVFSIMQGQQQTSLLPDLTKVNAPLFVLIGNNLCAAETEHEFHRLAGDDKTLLFGFQGTGGVREKTYSVCVRFGASRLTVGGLHRFPTERQKAVLTKAFSGTKYGLVFIDDMEGWLYCHAAFILPIVYISYAYDCDLRTAPRQAIDLLLNAAEEGYALIRKSGIKIRPVGDETYFESKPKMAAMKLAMLGIAKTTIGELVATDHCRNAVNEMEYLDCEFNKLREKSGNFPMPNWDRLRAAMPDWKHIHLKFDK